MFHQMKMEDWFNNQWGRFRLRTLALWASNFRYFFAGFVLGTIGTSAILLFCTYSSQINSTLLEIQSGDRLQFFTSIGASILGVLAITFSLAVFALQHAAENGSVQVLKDFSESPRVFLDYVTIAALAVLLFIFAFTPQGNGLFTSGSLLFAIVIIVFVLWRIYMFYRFIIDFINPAERFRKLGQKTADYLKKTRRLLLVLKLNEPRKSERPQSETESPATPRNLGIPEDDLFVTANFDHADIFGSFQSQISSLIDGMRLYTDKRKYEVTAAGYRSLAQMISVYFQQRKYSIAHASIFLDDGRTDQYLMFVLEQLNDLFRQLIKTEDQTGLQQNFQCFVGIAINANGYKILTRDVANPNVNFIVGYLHGNLVEALHKNVDDAVMNGVRHLRSVITYVPFENYLTIKQLGDEFEEQALISTQLKKWYITQEAVTGMVQIVAWGLVSKDISDSIIRSALEGLTKVAALYLQVGLDVGLNANGLNAAISNINQQSIPNLLNEYIVQHWEKELEFDERTFEKFLDYYKALGQISVSANSFLLHFVLSALDLHLRQLLTLKWNKKQYDVKNIASAVKETLSVYAFIFGHLPEGYTKKNFGYLEYEKLTSNALWAIKNNDKETVQEIVNAFLKFYKLSLPKAKDEFTSIRIYVDAVEIAAYAWASGMKDIAERVINLAPEVQAQHLQDHARDEIPEEYRDKILDEINEHLSREIWRMYADYHSYHPMRHPDIKIENMISYENLKTFLNLIEKKVYNREVTGYHRRSAF